MTERRVSALPDTGVEGVIYILEPGHVSYTWYGDTYHVHEQRPQTIPYPQQLGDVEEEEV